MNHFPNRRFYKKDLEYSATWAANIFDFAHTLKRLNPTGLVGCMHFLNSIYWRENLLLKNEAGLQAKKH